MTRRGWLLFAVMSVIWGLPYLLIKVAVAHLTPPVIVFGRTSVAAVVEVLLLCVGYAIGPFIVARRLGDVPTIGVVAVAVTAAAFIVAPLAWIGRPTAIPPATTLWAMLGLAFVCTAVAFVLFFALIAEVGPAHATLITFVNPAVAVVLGAIVLDESITAATIGGFVLVLTGCWLATRAGAAAPVPEIATAAVP
jgi:drug/metabolite transporter (DMT)-like permease